MAINATAIPSFPALTNGFGTVALSSPDAQIIHQVNYDISWYKDPAKDDGGWSIEMINPNDLCNGINNWKACENIMGGTPGRRNSVNNPSPSTFQLADASPINASQVQVYFTQFLDTLSINNQSFSINNGIGNPDSIEIMGSSCLLYFSQSFSQQQVYELTVTSTLKNCAQQNITGNLTLPFTFYNAKQNDVIITEIMADEDPSQGLPPYEYIEIYNRTAIPIQLKGWKLAVGNSEINLPFYLLQAHQYITLTKTAAQNLFPNNALYLPTFPALTNSGITLSMADADGDHIYSVAYMDTWIKDSYKRDGGWSLEMKDINNPCAGKENWDASIHADGGTPGAINSLSTSLPDIEKPCPIRIGIPSSDSLFIYFSEPLKNNISANQFTITNGIGTPIGISLEKPNLNVIGIQLGSALQAGITYQISLADSISDCVGNKIEVLYPLWFKLPETPMPDDVLLNEILFDPKGDGEDYIEIYNRSTKAIDIKNLSLGDYDSTTKHILSAISVSNRSALLMPGEYMLMSPNKMDIYVNYNTQHPNGFWDLSSMPSLSNTGGSIAVFDNNFMVLDAFTFTDKFHFSLLDNVDGVSLERINPEAKTQSIYNWTSASASSGYGTPGDENSQLGIPPENNDVINISPEIFSPDQDGFDDILFIAYEFPSAGNVLSINIYDENGRLIKKLLHTQYCGIKGEYTWDGGTDNNIRPKIGIYILQAEWYSATGEKGRAKKIITLGTKL